MKMFIVETELGPIYACAEDETEVRKMLSEEAEYLDLESSMINEISEVKKPSVFAGAGYHE